MSSTQKTNKTIDETALDPINVIEAAETEENNQKQEELEEEKILIANFNKLGNKLASAYKVVQTAKNIHKSVRDDISCAMALYEQIKEARKTIKDPFIGFFTKAIEKPPKAVETKEMDPKYEGKRSRRSISPERPPKKLITVETLRTIDTLSERETCKNDERNEWKKVKKRRKQNSAKKKSKQDKGIKHDKGEALTIKTNTDASYADVIKEMKRNINPLDMGIDIKTM